MKNRNFMKEEILAYLKDREEYIRFQSFTGGNAGCTDVQSAMESLQKVRLDPGLVHCYDVVDSTNEEARRAAVAGAPEGSLFVADRQTAGKGRRGRSWVSPGGEDLFFSIILRPAIPPASASMLTILAALAGTAAANIHSKEVCQIKWPNDILLHDRKICGILTEMAMDGDAIDYVVVGVGFNLNRMTFDDEIADIAGSIRRETGREVVRAAFFADYMEEFFHRYRIFLKAQSLSPFLSEYNRQLINKGRRVMLVRKDQELIRTAGGINEKGELIVYDDAGRPEKILSGEVSVRGLYGYVV